ncbi:S8 family peptidase [Falsiroseomonas selenitidurans]|uniref:S8 family serine peptidase n=1 Tax=Falsiroseomonas selenitidurans TaxID=2716335 RepID=A0ABX1E207_9PROT|nr:S8 family serine peptidase [Falsiroseomonas selenitidurans]NKC31189.1 S8 family serine peptidase [Falsiroseomonas selenitidurans]
MRGIDAMSYQYTALGRRVRLPLDPTAIALRFHDAPPKSGRARAVASVPGLQPFAARREVPKQRLTLLPLLPQAVGAPAPAAAIAALDRQPEVARALPVFRLGTAQVVPTERVIFAMRGDADPAPLLQRHRLVPLRQDTARILARAPDAADVFAICRRLSADPAVAYAEPNFVLLGGGAGPRLPGGGPDPMLRDQYALSQIKALEAQALVGGDPAIRIAVLDVGVDTGHPDLAAAVAATFDAIDGDGYQEPYGWDTHGTACAGLAAAVGGNGIGIRGVAAGCALVAVRIGRSFASDQDALIDTNDLWRGLRWAWQTGRADVLSNSWFCMPSSDIAAEIEQARTRGRGGRGCVVVVAAGNDGGPVGFPASLPQVLTVGASTPEDRVKTFNDPDVTRWATSHGPTVGLAAPGMRNLTTSVRPGGTGPGVYRADFHGTSAATPLVAGACALVLSARPELREDQVRDLLCRTADRIGPYPYRNGRNNHAGFGRLNLLRAIQEAQGLT